MMKLAEIFFVAACATYVMWLVTQAFKASQTPIPQAVHMMLAN